MKKTLILLALILSMLQLSAQNQELIQKARNYYALANQFASHGQFDSAIKYYKLAANIYKDINPVNYSIINLNLSNLYINLSEYDSAYSILTRIIPIIIRYKGENSKYLSSAYNNLGQIYLQYNKIDSAEIYFKKALEITKQNYGPQSVQLADIYSNLGSLYAMLNQYEKAKEFFIRAINIYEKYSNITGKLAITLNNLANIYNDLGQYDKALELLQKVLKIYQQIYPENDYKIAKVLLDIGSVYMDKDQYDLAKEYLQQALNKVISQYGSESLQAANVYYYFGILYDQTQQYSQALQFYLAALRIYREKLPENHPDIIGLINNIAVIYRTMGNYEMSKNYYLQALQAIKDINPNDRRIPIIYTNIASVFYNQNQLDSAIKYYNIAINLFYKFYGQHNPNLIKPLINLGYVYLKKDDFYNALKYFQKSIIANCPGFNDQDYFANPPIDEYYNGIKLLEALSNKIGAFIKLYKQSDSLNYLWSAYNTTLLADSLIHELRRTIITENDKLTLNLHTIKLYENGIFLTQELAKVNPQAKWEFLNKAFYFAERNKAALLVEAMNAAKAQKIAGIPDSLIEKEKNYRILIAFYENKLAKTEDLALINEYRTKLFYYKSLYRDLIAYFEKNYPKYYKIKYSTNFVPIQKLQQILRPNQAIISYFYGYKNLYSFLITKDTVRISVTQSTHVADTVLKLYKNIRINAPEAIKNFANSAYNLFLMVFPSDVPYTVKQLIIIPDDILNIVPFEVLLQNPDYKKDINNLAEYPYLIKSFSISYAYSSYLFYTLHYSEKRKIKGFDFLGIAPGFLGNNTPIFRNQKVPPLPGSIEEVKQIAKQFDSVGLYTKVLLDTAATETNFKHLDLTNFKIIHISTHGLIFSDHPEWSALIFSKEQQPDDGFLFVGEIYNLQINSSLVALSACETGLGKISRGEGVIGMARAFFYAGAQNLLISLWKVSDMATKDLMIQFYRSLLAQTQLIDENTSYSEALRQAKLWMINNGFSHPYYWASFILIGK